MYIAMKISMNLLSSENNNNFFFTFWDKLCLQQFEMKIFLLQLLFTVKVSIKGLKRKKKHTATMPSTSDTKVSLTNPREVMSQRRYWWNPPGPECVWVPLMATFLSLYKSPYLLFRRLIICNQQVFNKILEMCNRHVSIKMCILMLNNKMK